MRSFIFAALAAISFAAKQEGSTADEIVAWYKENAKPAVDMEREAAMAQMWADLEVQNGPLLATCAKGTACRDELRKEVEETIEEEWTTILQTFQKQIENHHLKTKLILEEAWTKAVICEEANPCCEVSETVWDNLIIQITETEKLMRQKKTQWEELERRRLEMESECPEVDFTQYSGELIAFDIEVPVYEEPIIKIEAPLPELEIIEEPEIEVLPAPETSPDFAEPPVLTVDHGAIYQGPNVQAELDAKWIKSIDSAIPFRATFNNNSGMGLEIYWIDYEGNPVYYSFVAEGQFYDINTYVTHPWALRDQDGWWHAITVIDDRSTPANDHIIFNIFENEYGWCYFEV